MRRPHEDQARGDLVEVRAPKKRKIETLNNESHSETSDRDFARSSAAGWTPPIRVTSEQDALKILKRAWRSHQTVDSTNFIDKHQRSLLIVDLHEFEIYRTPNAKLDGRNYELMSLHYWDAPASYSSSIKLAFDGFLCIGALKVYVQGLSIEFCSLEGYGEDESPDVVTYVQSPLASTDTSYDMWFRVGRPSQSYKRFHGQYTCVAQFAKHTLDFLEEHVKAPVGLHSFKTDFHAWLTCRFGHDASFQKWHKDFMDRVDFRCDINAYRELLYREAHNHPSSVALLAHPLWAECMAGGLTAVEKQPLVSNLTITTPRVYQNFKHMYFGGQLHAMPVADKVKKAQRRRMSELGFAEEGPNIPWSKPRLQPYKSSQVNVGDVIAFDPDEVDTKRWKKTEKQEWLAYVQSTKTLREGVQRLFVLHMYRPSDTHIGTAKYDFKNEIFFSDNCNCEEHELLSTDVKGRYHVEWLPRIIDPLKGYFARQTYITNDSAFITLEEKHRTCRCRAGIQSKISPSYQVGDTVYITQTFEHEDILEPATIRHVDSNSTEVTIRILLRLSRDCAQLAMDAGRTGDLPPNELVLTNKLLKISFAKIQRHCNIRYVSRRDLKHGRLPFGYDRGGAGDFWFLSMGIATENAQPRLVYLARPNGVFVEGTDPTDLPDTKPLIGLSMFTGSGNLDRGLEEGGTIEFRHVIDMDGPAIHTQRANAKDPSNLRQYYGSVDDYMALLLSGVEHELVARIGSVCVIAAGSPCPGFSTLQQDIFSKSSIEHASHITTLWSAVEMYRPKYAILENVVSMAYTRKGLEDQNVLSQLISCLVSLGYQVSQFIVDSYNCGSAQHRSRLFVSIAAPGLEPMKQPFHTHSRPWKEVTGKSLGKLPNGENFGQREWHTTPFRYVTAGAIIGDVPDIGNGNVQTCVSHPDHRLSASSNHSERSLLACIPSAPPGCGYKEAFERGLIPEHLQKPGREHGKGYKRIDQAKLIPTITTTINCRDAHNGACVHWNQPRALTILEARRAQGFPDEEPIIGNRVEQYRTVGNAVDRKVSFALGLSLRESVMVNMRKELVTKTEQEIIIEMEEDEEHLSDVDSDASEITLAIPQLDGGDDRLAMLSRSSGGKKPSKKLSADDKNTANSSSHPQLSKDLSDNESETKAAQSQVPSLVAVTRHLKSVTIDSRRPSLSPAATPNSKQSHGDSDTEDHLPRKLHLSGAHGRGSPLDGTSSKMKTNDVSKAKELSAKKRYTRHTGLEVEFVPQQWDKRPELLHSKTAR